MLSSGLPPMPGEDSCGAPWPETAADSAFPIWNEHYSHRKFTSAYCSGGLAHCLTNLPRLTFYVVSQLLIYHRSELSYSVSLYGKEEANCSYSLTRIAALAPFQIRRSHPPRRPLLSAQMRSSSGKPREHSESLPAAKHKIVLRGGKSKNSAERTYHGELQLFKTATERALQSKRDASAAHIIEPCAPRLQSLLEQWPPLGALKKARRCLILFGWLLMKRVRYPW